MRGFYIFTILMMVVACRGSRVDGGQAVPTTVRRVECLEIAESYARLRWRPTVRNVRHGRDAAGVRVDTPDVTWRRPGAVPGWWRPGVWQVSMPYQWGGFATPEEFLAGVAAGKAAGDVYTLEKRRLLDAGVSGEATGIDCSGFISRCWKLPRAWSTRELAQLCEPLSSWSDLRPGDILNTYNAHVMLFTGWVNAERTMVSTLETGRPPHWFVTRHVVPVARLKEEGFVPLRYRGMVD